MRKIVTFFAALLLAGPGGAQMYSQSPIYKDRNGNYQGATGTFKVTNDGTSERESYQLVGNNTPSAATAVYGGDYILTQACATYGTVAFQVLGPDATTWLPLATYTTRDTGSGHAFALGSYAVVRVAVSGTTSCYALLSRVPA